MSRQLIKDVSLQELMELRMEGLTNGEIASRLGCCRSTIYNYLGKQPPGVRARRGSLVHGGADEKNAFPAPVQGCGAEKAQALRKVAQTTVYEGRHGRYTVNSFGAVKITIPGCDAEIALDMAGMEEYIMELLDVWQAAEGAKTAGGGTSNASD